MEWKDTGNTDGSEKNDPYYDDDGYGTFTEKRRSSGFFSKNTSNLYLGIAGVAIVMVVLGILVFSPAGESEKSARIDELQKKIEQLEKQLEQVNAQAQGFATFDARVEASEKTIALQMTHMSTNLEALQKKADDLSQQVSRLARAQASAKPATASVSPSRKPTAPAKAPVKKPVPPAPRKPVAASVSASSVKPAVASAPASAAKPAAPPVAPSSSKPAATAATPAAPATSAPASTAGSSSAKTHTVAAGETLYSLAKQYNLTVSQLRAVNNLAEDAVIQIGQRLLVEPPAGP
ncbi:LysM peptidoglycan-binding domain-containing protein [Desulfosarcina sp. OttesenSCG-928-A07]|nr:LysM peptidoglycan-binding domain-containing protein [Desulfosarcina sp. OttesenSCG-928-A07]